MYYNLLNFRFQISNISYKVQIIISSTVCAGFILLLQNFMYDNLLNFRFQIFIISCKFQIIISSTGCTCTRFMSLYHCSQNCMYYNHINCMFQICIISGKFQIIISSVCTRFMSLISKLYVLQSPPLYVLDLCHCTIAYRKVCIQISSPVRTRFELRQRKQQRERHVSQIKQINLRHAVKKIYMDLNKIT